MVILKHLPTAVDCGSLATLFNGVVDTSSGTTFMMTATYTCNTGYNIVGSESRTCGASGTSGATTPSDGVWSPAAPVFCESMLSQCLCPCMISYSLITERFVSENLIDLLQLSTVVPWTTRPMEQWTHPLEPLSSKELPTPVTLDTL